MDITELILSDHREQRRMFALLDELGGDPARLAPVWQRLAVLLEVHAEAEERIFYQPPGPARAGDRVRRVRGGTRGGRGQPQP